MKTLRRILWVFWAIVGFYLIAWPVPVEPVAWESPPSSGYEGVSKPNSLLQHALWFDLKGHDGAEDIAIAPEGHVVVATHDGWLMVKQPGEVHFEALKKIEGGRPLGIEFDAHKRLWIAVAGRGLLYLSPTGELVSAVEQIEGSPVLYADDVAVGPDGLIYLSDATQRFDPNKHGGTLKASILDLMEHQKTGRIIVYDPVNFKARVWLDGLSFANGVTVSHDQKSLLIAETGMYRVLKVPLMTREDFGSSDQPQPEVAIDQLPGFPDNLSTDAVGLYWVGLTNPRNGFLDGTSEYPFLRKLALRLPELMRPQPVAYGHVLAFDNEGQVQVDWQDPSGKYGFATGAVATPYGWWVSNLKAPVIGLMKRAAPSTLVDE